MKNVITDLLIKVMVLYGKYVLKDMNSNAVKAREVNDKLLFSILKKNKFSEFGKLHHFENINSIDDFRKNVSLSTYADYDAYVSRMVDGEENVLTSLPVIGYAKSTGSSGKPKIIPVVKNDINTFKKYTIGKTLGLADAYYRKINGKGLQAGRGLFVAPAANDHLSNGIPMTNIVDVASRELSFIFPYIIAVPFNKLYSVEEIDLRYVVLRLALEEENLLFMYGVFFMNFTDIIFYLQDNWKQLCQDIEKGVISDISRAKPEVKTELESVLKPNPKRADSLVKEFEKGFDSTILKRIWNNLSIISAIGTGTFGQAVKKVREYAGEIPFDYSIYGASEGMFAACDELDSDRQLLLSDSCFFEFIPVDEPDKALLMDELEVGKEYEIVITNWSGLYRYRCGDVIRVTGFNHQCPYIIFSHRQGALLNMFGEKVSEEDILHVISGVEKDASCKVNDWCIFCNMEKNPNHYVLFLEADKEKDLSVFSEDADLNLMNINDRYKVIRGATAIGQMEIVNLKKDSQKAWKDRLIEKGASPSQIKPVRILDSEEKQNFFLERVRK